MDDFLFKVILVVVLFVVSLVVAMYSTYGERKISAFMQIENENNPLKNNFNNQPKSSIKNSFIEETEIIEEENDFSEHYDNKDEISRDDEREMFNDLFRES